MRALPARRTATSVLCAAFLLGIAGPVAVAADHDPVNEARPAAAQAPVPGADALLAQTKSLGDVAGALKPVTDLLDAALKADNGQLSAADATKLADAVKEAIAKAAAVPGAPSVPAAPPAVLPALPGAHALPRLEAADHTDARVELDLGTDTLKALQDAVDSLIKAVTGGDATAVGTAAPTVVTGLVDFIAAVVLGGGLPAPNLPGLPKLPTDEDAPSASGLPPA